MSPPPAPDLVLLADDVEVDLRASVRAVLDKTCTPAQLAALSDGTDVVSGPAWQGLAVDLGLAGLLVPEERGGAGAGAVEAAAVLGEIGRSCAPVPFLTSSVLAITALLALPANEPVDALVRRLAEGSVTAAVLVPATTRSVSALPTGVCGGEDSLSGAVRGVLGVAGFRPEVLLVPVPDRAAGRVALHVVPIDAAGVGVTDVVSLDMTRPLADVSLDGSSSTLLAEDAGAALDTALMTAAALLASEQAGLAAYALETTVAYLRERRQFGRVVGGFQALKHRLADLYAEVESAGAAARYAAAALAVDHRDAEVAAAVAASYCAEVAVHACEEAVQLHGGIGMTWEHPMHLHLKRAKADQLVLGTPERHRARLATLVDLPGPTPAALT